MNSVCEKKNIAVSLCVYKECVYIRLGREKKIEKNWVLDPKKKFIAFLYTNVEFRLCPPFPSLLFDFAAHFF